MEKNIAKGQWILKAGVVFLTLLALLLFYLADKESEDKKNYYEEKTGIKLE